MKSWTENKPRLKYLLIITGTTLGVYLGLRYMLPLILPFLFAYFLAWLIRPSTELLYRKLKIPRLYGGIASLILFLAITGTGIFYLCKVLIKQTIAFIRNIPVYLSYLTDKLDNICSSCDDIFGLSNGTLRTAVDENLEYMVDGLRTKVMPGITQRTITFTITMVAVFGIIVIILISAVLIAKDLPDFKKKYENSSIYQELHRVTERLADAGIAYLKCQLIIMVIVAFLSVLGLTILKNEYAALAGVLIAFMDALPILGSGIVYIPWSIIMLINGNIYAAAVLITIFLVCMIIREVLEPKLIGNKIGVRPLFTLMSMYVGVKLFSIAGFILGPIGLIIIITIVKAVIELSSEGEMNSLAAGTTDYPLDKDNYLS